MIKRMPTQPLHWPFLLVCVSCLPTVALSQSVENEKADPVVPPMADIKLTASDQWEHVRSDERRTLWVEKPSYYYLLSKHPGKRKFPLDDIDKFRAFARQQAATLKGGLVEADFLQFDGKTVGFFIIKNTFLNRHGYRYIGRCLIPGKGGWYELRMDSLPGVVTGKREAVLNVTLNLLPNITMEPIPAEAPPTPRFPPRKPGNERVKGFYKDPYDSKFDASGNYSVTDNAKYDAEFPDHPLTRLRKKFPELMKALVMPNDDAETDKTTDSPR